MIEKCEYFAFLLILFLMKIEGKVIIDFTLPLD